MSNTEKAPSPATMPSLMRMVSQGELRNMQIAIQACHATLYQIACLTTQGTSKIELDGGIVTEVPAHAAMAMATLAQVFGVQFSMTVDESKPAAPEVSEPEPPLEDSPPTRTAWRPSIVKNEEYHDGSQG